MRRPLRRLSALFTCALVLCSPSPASAQATDILGSWEGVLDPGGGIQLTLVYHVESAAGGGLTGTLDSPDQSATGMPLSTVTFVNGTLTMVAESIPGEPTFVGTLSEDGSTLTGTFLQGDGSLPLELTRQEDPA